MTKQISLNKFNNMKKLNFKFIIHGKDIKNRNKGYERKT